MGLRTMTKQLREKGGFDAAFGDTAIILAVN
jgi:hypothetical protein